MRAQHSQDGLVLLWSGGKDAMLALDVLYSQSPRRVGALLTTVTEEDERVTMHGTPLALIEHQAEALGVPLHVMRVPPETPNEVYEARLEAALTPLLENGFSTVVAGDIFLDDVRAYREQLLASLGATPMFPLWERDTTWLAQHFLNRGYQAVVTAVDSAQLDASFVGRTYDKAFLEDLPEEIDPCGEHGAFHTFVTDGPPFEHSVSSALGQPETGGRICTVPLMLADEER